MPVPSPWDVKKRGDRTSGSSQWGYWSELLLSLCMVVVGGGALVLHVSQVLLPEWRRAAQLDELEASTCRIIDKRITSRDALGGTEYTAELLVEPIADGVPLPPVWTAEGFAMYSPHRDDAQGVLKAYEIGSTHPCWYNPDDSDLVVLGRRFRWWPWPVALLPASLLAVGLWGVTATLLQVTTTAERRRVVSRRVQSLDPLSSASGKTGIELSGSYEQPGTHLAYRLPIDSSPNWRLVGMIFVNTLWNTLLVYFGYVATLSWMRGNPRWLVSWLVLLLGSIGVWLAFRLIQELWSTRRIGMTQIEVSHHPIVPGQTITVYLAQTGRGKLASLAVELICEEQAMFLQGTDSRQWIECVHRQPINRWRRLAIEPGQPFIAEFELQLDSRVMHTFVATHNQVRWWLVVRATARRGTSFERRFPIDVQPPEAPGVVDASDVSLEARS